MDNKTFNNKKWNENRTHRRDGTADLMDQHFTRTEEELKSSELTAIAEFISESGVTVEQLKSMIEKENLNAAE